MSRLEETEASWIRSSDSSKVHELIFPCDAAGCGHYLRLSWDEDDDDSYPTHRYLFIDGYVQHRGIWSRIKSAVKMVLGKEVDTTDVFLSELSARNLLEFLKERLDD